MRQARTKLRGCLRIIALTNLVPSSPPRCPTLGRTRPTAPPTRQENHTASPPPPARTRSAASLPLPRLVRPPPAAAPPPSRTARPRAKSSSWATRPCTPNARRTNGLTARFQSRSIVITTTTTALPPLSPTASPIPTTHPSCVGPFRTRSRSTRPGPARARCTAWSRPPAAGPTRIARALGRPLSPRWARGARGRHHRHQPRLRTRTLARLLRTNMPNRLMRTTHRHIRSRLHHRFRMSGRQRPAGQARPSTRSCRPPSSTRPSAHGETLAARVARRPALGSLALRPTRATGPCTTSDRSLLNQFLQ